MAGDALVDVLREVARAPGHTRAAGGTPEQREGCVCGRQAAELAVDGVFLLHPGYDLRIVLATEVQPAEIAAVARGENLFTYEGDSNLATLQPWLSG